MTVGTRSENLRRGAIWLLLAGAIAYRALHLPPAMSERLRASVMSHRALWISGLLWVVITLYWEIQARNAEADAKAEHGASRAFHVLLVNAALLLLFVPVPGLNGRWIFASSFTAATGLGVELCAVLLAVWSRRALGRNWSGRITIKHEHRLIRSGPYRFVRHPIYTAFLGMYLVSGELHALVGLILAALAYWRKIRIEEENLAAHFGAEWIDYRGATGSLVPGVR